MSYSNQIINGFIKSELGLFKKHFYDRPIAKVKDDRSLAIAWLCYYFGDKLNDANKADIIHFVDEVYWSADYSTFGWSRIKALEAASFILTNDNHYSNCILDTLDCRQSLDRRFLIKSISIICPLLSFNNVYLKEATENNIKYLHIGYEENIILYLLTQGTKEEKIEWIDNQICIDKKNRVKKFLMSIKTSGLFLNSGFFLCNFNTIKSYIIFNLINRPIHSKIQLELFAYSELNYRELMEIEEKHPLNNCYIDFRFLTNK